MGALDAVGDHLEDALELVVGAGGVADERDAVVRLHEAAVVDAVVGVGHVDAAAGLLDDLGEDDALVDLGGGADGVDGAEDHVGLVGGVELPGFAPGLAEGLVDGFHVVVAGPGGGLGEGAGGAGEALVAVLGGLADGVGGGLVTGAVLEALAVAHGGLLGELAGGACGAAG